jgi:hypothetical protein
VSLPLYLHSHLHDQAPKLQDNGGSGLLLQCDSLHSTSIRKETRDGSFRLGFYFDEFDKESPWHFSQVCLLGSLELFVLLILIWQI